MIELVTSLALAAQAQGFALQRPDSNVPFHAMGTEPFWGLSVENGRIVYDPAGQQGVAVPAPARQETPRGYRWRTPRINVEVNNEVCGDGMSMRVYPVDVKVMVLGRTLLGCGGYAFRGTLANSTWQIVNVTFDAVGGPAYRLDFTGDRMSGEVACVRFSGPYAANADGTLRIGLVEFTRRNCHEEQAELEQNLRELFAEPIRLSTSEPGGGALAIGNENGGFLLRRAR
jgi:uncharacterized membrane protein/heat shock protein HslJ